MSKTKIKNDERSNQNKCWWITAKYRKIFDCVWQFVKFIFEKVRNVFFYNLCKEKASAAVSKVGDLLDQTFQVEEVELTQEVGQNPSVELGRGRQQMNQNPSGEVVGANQRNLRNLAQQDIQEYKLEDLKIDLISAIENEATKTAQRRMMDMARDLSYHVDDDGNLIMDIDLEDRKTEICVNNDGSVKLNIGLNGVRSAILEEIPKIFNEQKTRFVFFGASGSGKSALINRLRGIYKNQLSAEDRALEDTGAAVAGAAAKHLTLHKLGGLEIIDTPGYTPGSGSSKDYIGKIFNDANMNPHKLDYFDLPVMVLDATQLKVKEKNVEKYKFNKEDELIIKSLLDNRFSRITVVLNKVEFLNGETVEQQEEKAKKRFFKA